MFLFCLTESETTDSVPSDEENAEVSAFWIFSSLDQGIKIHALRYFSPFSTEPLSTSGIFILVIAGGKKQTRRFGGYRHLGGCHTVIELISLQINFSSSVQTTKLICMIRCSAEPSTVPAIC